MSDSNPLPTPGSRGPAVARTRRNQAVVLLWSLVWMISWVGVTLALTRGWLSQGAPGTVAAILSSSLGVGTLLAYRRFLKEADELQRRIEVEALALAFGVGLVGGLAYWLLQRSGALPKDEKELLYVLAGMSLTYAAAGLLGNRRYA